MLKELFIQNIAIIDDLTLKLSPGLNVITGETGAGKSVIIGALGLLLGLRASSDILRTGCDKGFVSGAFEIDAAVKEKVSELAIPDIDDGLLVMSREISREGRNVCRINEKIFSLSGFRAVGSILIDIYGQNEERGLLLPSNQLEILDQLGGSSLLELKQAVWEHSKKIKDLEREIETQERQEQEFRDQVDFLQFQFNELEAAGLNDVNEEEALEEEIRILAGAEELAQTSLVVYSLLFGGEGNSVPAYDKISSSLSALETMVTTDPSLREKADQLQEVLYSVQDISEFIRDYADRIEHNPQKLAILRDRLDLIKRLKGKYRRSVEELIAYRNEIAAALKRSDSCEERLLELRQEKESAEKAYLAAADRLSVLRAETGRFLSQQVGAVLTELEMKDARFEVEFSPLEGYPNLGKEEVRFVFSANKGEPLKLLQKVASGGELSRLMLALKSILAKVDSVPVMVFDEADAGIGGEAAAKVGIRIAALSKAHQVICVTHSAQVAVFADKHFVISKTVSRERTASQVQHVSGREQVLEVARMLGGKELDTAILHAEKILEDAAAKKIAL